MGVALLIIGGYVVGSIPFGVIVGRAWRGVDVREYGSHNIGFANALRVLGWGPALAVLVGDVVKGLGPVLVGRELLAAWAVPGRELWIFAVAIAPILGHSFSVFLRLRGGRAVATTLGALLGMSWPAALVGLGVWLLLVGTTRRISVGSMGACAAVPAYMALSGHSWELSVFWGGVGLLVILRHVSNIGRLVRGTEPKIGQRVEVKEAGGRGGVQNRES